MPIIHTFEHFEIFVRVSCTLIMSFWYIGIVAIIQSYISTELFYLILLIRLASVNLFMILTLLFTHMCSRPLFVCYVHIVSCSSNIERSQLPPQKNLYWMKQVIIRIRVLSLRLLTITSCYCARKIIVEILQNSAEQSLIRFAQS